MGQNYRAQYLQLVALAQADLGDLKTALLTAESIPELKQVDASFPFPYKEMTLVELQARSGDFGAAKKAADSINEKNAWQKGYALRVIARLQAEGKDVKGALATADGIEHAFNKTAAYTEIAQAQARAGDQDGSAKSFEKAVALAEAVPEAPTKTDLDRSSLRPRLLQSLAAAQSGAGQDKAVGEWIAKLSSPNLKAWALTGLAEGIVSRQAPKKPSTK